MLKCTPEIYKPRKRLAVGIDTLSRKTIKRDLMSFLRRPEKSWKGLPNLGDKLGDLYYIDNGSDILGVAHMDSVQSESFVREVGDRIYHPQLDDKLGIFTLMELLPMYNINIDILLTDNEEYAQSTAQMFETDKQYNWIIEFDRGGTDVVMYQYHDSVTEEAVRMVGMVPGHGSYSDITDLEHLGCSAWNWGNAMYDYHSRYAYMEFEEYLDMVDAFVEFHDIWKDTFFETFLEPASERKAYSPYSYSRFWDEWPFEEDSVASYDECLFCGDYFSTNDLVMTTDGALCKPCANACGIENYTAYDEEYA